MRLPCDGSTREHLTWLFALTVDADGNEHLIGLTPEDSAWYLNYSNASIFRRQFGDVSYEPWDEGQRDRYLALHEKMERARHELMARTYEARRWIALSRPTEQ